MVPHFMCVCVSLCVCSLCHVSWGFKKLAKHGEALFNSLWSKHHQGGHSLRFVIAGVDFWHIKHFFWCVFLSCANTFCTLTT